MHYVSPDWRQPRSKSEADSLILDMILYLEETAEDSSERDAALANALKMLLHTQCNKELDKAHTVAVLNVFLLYCKDSPRAIATLLKLSSHDEKFISLIDTWIKDRDALISSQTTTPQKIVDELKASCVKTIADAIEEYNGVGRSIVLWKNHKLVYMYSGGLINPILKPAIPASSAVEIAQQVKEQLTINGPLPAPQPKISKTSYFNANMIWHILTIIIVVWAVVCIFTIKD